MNAEKVTINRYADVQSEWIGDGTVIWQFAVVVKGAKIGCDCNINCHTFIEGNVVIGNNVTVKAGVYLWNGIKVADDVFIGPNVTFTNDKYPRSKKYPASFQVTELGKGCSIGAGSIILGGVRIGEYAVIGAGCLVTKDVPAYALIKGSPGAICGWVDEGGKKLKDSGDGTWVDEGGHFYVILNDQLTRI